MIRSIFLLSFLLLAVSCGKDEPRFFDATSPVTLKVQHHEDALPGMEVYIQYNAKQFPGYDDRSVFDTMVIGNEFGDAIFPKVPIGQHWVIGYGFDEAVGESVRGGLSFEITKFGIAWDSTLYVSEY
ncbi:MAG: hypothetical protein AB8F74_15225 [Saprospiraceae bacterium]